MTPSLRFQKGDRVKAFDHLLYKNDNDTPLSVTMCPATVVACYEGVWTYAGRVIVDVVFDHRPDTVSVGHFIEAVEPISGDGYTGVGNTNNNNQR